MYLINRIFFFLALFLIPKLLFADRLIDAQRQKDRAYGQYYRALTDLPHEPSLKERDLLRKKIIKPAEYRFATVFNDEIQQFLKEQKFSVVVNYRADATVPSVSTQKSESNSKTGSPKPAPKKLKLDGRKIPKLLEFPGDSSDQE